MKWGLDLPSDFAPIYREILPSLRAHEMEQRLNSCPVGDGDRFECVVAELFLRLLAPGVDPLTSERRYKNAGARGDLLLPFSLLGDEVRVLREWKQAHGLRSILVEAKNEKKKASVEDVKQVFVDMQTACAGNLAFLVARAGFTSDAIREMAALWRGNKGFIYPVDEMLLLELSRATPAQGQQLLFRHEEIARKKFRSA
jgi:hypothetical protein